MKSKILSIALVLTTGFGFFSCQKQQDPTPTKATVKVPFRVAKSQKTFNTSGVNEGFTSFVITTSEGFSYTMTFQEVNGYTALVVTNPGGTEAMSSIGGGDCMNKIVSVLERWANQSSSVYQSDNACSIVTAFISDLHSLEDCVPSDEQNDFDDTIDQLEELSYSFCQ